MTDFLRSQQNLDPVHDLRGGGAFWFVDQKETAIYHDMVPRNDAYTGTRR